MRPPRTPKSRRTLRQSSPEIGPSRSLGLLLGAVILGLLIGGIRLAEALMPEDGGGHPIEIDPGDGDGGGGGGGGEEDPITPEDGSKLLAELSSYYQAMGQQAADPVQLPGGHFVECRTDLFVPGRGLDFEWRRCYRSSLGAYQVPEHTIIGVNWYLNYDQRLEFVLDSNLNWYVERDVLWRNGTGGVEEFTSQQEGTNGTWGNYEWHSKSTGSVLRAYAGVGGPLGDSRIQS